MLYNYAGSAMGIFVQAMLCVLLLLLSFTLLIAGGSKFQPIMPRAFLRGGISAGNEYLQWINYVDSELYLHCSHVIEHC